MHILGFDSSRFGNYLDPSTGSPYAYTIVQTQTLYPGRGSNSILKTPFVTEWAEDFFQCFDIDGMALENEDGSGSGAGSHW